MTWLRGVVDHLPWLMIHNINPSTDHGSYHVKRFQDCFMYSWNKWVLEMSTWVESPCTRWICIPSRSKMLSAPTMTDILGSASTSVTGAAAASWNLSQAWSPRFLGFLRGGCLSIAHLVGAPTILCTSLSTGIGRLCLKPWSVSPAKWSFQLLGVHNYVVIRGQTISNERWG